jgi:hypothetical protein
VSHFSKKNKKIKNKKKKMGSLGNRVTALWESFVIELEVCHERPASLCHFCVPRNDLVHWLGDVYKDGSVAKKGLRVVTLLVMSAQLGPISS